jgi:hypothetical protein
MSRGISDRRKPNDFIIWPYLRMMRVGQVVVRKAGFHSPIRLFAALTGRVSREPVTSA